jgi:hypothetical protein
MHTLRNLSEKVGHMAKTFGRKVIISEGELLDTPSLKINISLMIVKVDKPARQYFEELMRYCFSHHAIAAPGLVGKQLKCFARKLGIEVN